jgi:hypothetical protein
MTEELPSRRGPPQRRAERRITSLAALKRELEASGTYRDVVLRGLEFGDVWWIPDEFTTIGIREGHPWVVVVPYRAGRPLVEACLRTTSGVHGYGIAGLVTPAGVIAGLNEEGCIVFSRRQKFFPRDFADFHHVGKLPDDWCQRLRHAIDEWGKNVALQSEEP